jgi:SRSO17 transposase
MVTMIDARLYLPEDWCKDDECCKKAAIPEDKRQFQSKTQLALAMLKIARQRGIQFGYIGIDGGYGKDPAFLRGVDEQGCRFVADVHCVKQFISKTQNRRYPIGQVAAGSLSIVNPQCAGQRVDQWTAAQTADACSD